MIVTGVGSKSVSETGAKRVKEIAKLLNRKGYLLRSGGCEGTDSLFESEFHNKEIYLPWKGFNRNKSELFSIDEDAFSLASKVHPYYFRLPIASKKLHARNCYQVLGKDLNTPSDLIVCWTKDGAYNEEMTTMKTGGTRTAIVLGSRYNIPVYNLYWDTHYEALLNYLK